MKILLAAINAKYIHSNLAVYSLQAYARENAPELSEEIYIKEYTINQLTDQILMDLYKEQPDVICFSCYIWNITQVKELLVEIPKILPKTMIWLGGPEVTYHPIEMLEAYPMVRGIMKGEGEETFVQLLHAWNGEVAYYDLDGITYWEEAAGEVWNNPDQKTMDMNKLPFVYQDMDLFRHKIVYYESSRGCPFSCSYCLSSVEKCLRFRDARRVVKELQFFIDQKVPQVKFVDRTFNCNKKRAIKIWKYIKEHDQGVTNFHFEIAADLLDEESLEVLEDMRPGLVQLEIGIQSTNPETLKEIHRTMNFEKVAERVKRINQKGNIHQHLDLIAGLPYENYRRFGQSFDDVFKLRPQQLQLGFLKVLKGSYMEEMAATYKMQYQNRPPFEVLSTRWLSYKDVIRLKEVEDMVEVYYNSGMFDKTIAELVQRMKHPFRLFEHLADYYKEHGYQEVNHTKLARYEILYDFMKEVTPSKLDRLQRRLTFDLYWCENIKNRPEFCGEPTVTKEEENIFYKHEEEMYLFLKEFRGYDRRQMRKMTHLERQGHQVYAFDYLHRDPITKKAKVLEILI